MFFIIAVGWTGASRSIRSRMVRSVMKHVIPACLFVIALRLSGCTGEGAKEMFETAQFEERQNNQVHAKQLYEAIIKDFPNSEYAKKAGERLAQLSQGK